jgi:glycosyltransferase involved in cell wall biosynthesis
MNILLLTNCLPEPDDREKGVTSVVSYFAKEWSVLGHKVIIIHNSSKFFLPFYYLPKLILDWIRKKTNTAIPSVSSRKVLSRVEEDVETYRLPMFRWFPGAPFSRFQYKKQQKKIQNILNEKNFIPDVISGHWFVPQLELGVELSKYYSAKTGIVIHGSIPKKITPKQRIQLANIDNIFFRSDYMLSEAKKTYKEYSHKMKVCYSGIPESFFEGKLIRTDWKDFGVFKILYVGRLITYKRVDAIIDAVAQAFPKKRFLLEIIGDGVLRAELQQRCINKNVENQVRFYGRLPRQQVIDKMSETDCFVMISEKETFGLVYLEAMASGAITVASFDGGVDGIIINKENGFLSTQGDSDRLAELLIHINNLPSQEVMRIRQNAMSTVHRYSDRKVAEKYLNDIIRTI